MGKLIKLKVVLAAVVFGFVLSSCGGEDAFEGTDPDGSSTPGTGSGNGGGIGTPGGGAQSGVPSSIAVSYPITDAITNLGAGFYSRIGSAIVVDGDGNIVPDGTEVRFKVIDSVKAIGTINVGDSVTGTVLTIAAPTLSDGTATTLAMAGVTRGPGNFRGIEPEDQVFLFTADQADLVRSVSGATLTANTLNVTSAYANTYPNTTYPTGGSTYVVGASHIGVDVEGIDAEGNLYTGTISTVNGIANFAIVYPANINTIMVGCGSSVVNIDTRYDPAASADVYLGAYVPGTDVATISQPCFSPIAGGTLAVVPETLSSTGFVTITYRDGGDTIPVSYAGISANVTITTNTGGLSVTVVDIDPGPATTNRTKTGGSITYAVTVAGGATDDKATITFSAGTDITTEVTVAIP